MRGTAPRDLRRERLIGNWGGASEQIGRRWEEVGLAALGSRVASGARWPGGAQPEKVLPLAQGGDLEAVLSRVGLPNPDVIVVLRERSGRIALQALDFKWNVEFATYGQIRAEALRALLDYGVAPLQSLLADALDGLADGTAVRDGLLLAPELPVNRWFLGSERNNRQEYPIEEHEVLFEEVNAPAFFQPLPGWEMALLLARTDRSEPRLRVLETAEHYYRIGAGVQGAVSQLQQSVFVRQPPRLPAQEVFDWLRAKVRPSTSQDLSRYIERMMAGRIELQGRLRNLTRSPYRFSDLVAALKAGGVEVPEREEGFPPEERRKWGDLLRAVAVEHREVIYRTGLRLVGTGLSDAEALTRLEAEPARYADRAKAHAERLLAVALHGS